MKDICFAVFLEWGEVFIEGDVMEIVGKSDFDIVELIGKDCF